MNTSSVQLSGRDREWVYYMRGRKQCRRRYVVPRDPRSPAQMRARAALAAASRFWSHCQDITDQERDAWEAVANRVQSRPRLGQSGPLTGQQYYVACQCAKNRRRRPIPAAARANRAPLGHKPEPARPSGAAASTWEPRRTCAGPTRGRRAASLGRRRAARDNVSIPTRPRWPERPARRLGALGWRPVPRACCPGGATARFPCGSHQLPGPQPWVWRQWKRAMARAPLPQEV